jgi:hypothetical protein
MTATFSHLALINAVVHLIRVDERLTAEPGRAREGVEAVTGT